MVIAGGNAGGGGHGRVAFANEAASFAMAVRGAIRNFCRDHFDILDCALSVFCGVVQSGDIRAGSVCGNPLFRDVSVCRLEKDAGGAGAKEGAEADGGVLKKCSGKCSAAGDVLDERGRINRMNKDEVQVAQMVSDCRGAIWAGFDFVSEAASN